MDHVCATVATVSLCPIPLKVRYTNTKHESDVPPKSKYLSLLGKNVKIKTGGDDMEICLSGGRILRAFWLLKSR